MHSPLTYISLLVTTFSTVAARSAQHVGKKLPERAPMSPRVLEDVHYPQYNKRQYVNTTTSESLMHTSFDIPLGTNSSRIQRQRICDPRRQFRHWGILRRIVAHIFQGQ